MERERGSKVIAIIALCVGVVGLSLGFAAFSSNLVIQPSANVTPSAGEFKVQFANPTAGQAEGGATGATPTVAEESVKLSTGDATASVIRGLSATFTAPGQKVTYTFDAENAGKYIAYLNSVKYVNATGKDAFKVCTAGAGTTQTLVDSACNDISLTLSIAGKDYSATNEAVSGHSLAIGAEDTVLVTIEYKAAAEGSTNTLADGDFTVTFGTIELVYGSVD